MDKSGFSLSLSPTAERRVMPSVQNPAVGSFANRRGNIKFSSGRSFGSPKAPLRVRKGPFLSFRSTRKMTARPARSKAVFDSLLAALQDGIITVRQCITDKKKELLDVSSEASCRKNYYMDAEKQVKTLERRVRTLEVHTDRIEELRDDYVLKIKLRDGAINLCQALSTQSSKAAKVQLQEVRAEQRDLLEDMCDIEDEVETKLGVFNVHINGLVGLNRPLGGDLYEAHLKLASQKWKAKCKTCRHQQFWQDADIMYLGKLSDELCVKVVEVRRIQGNALIGSIKCHTREFFSFNPLNVTFNFPNSTVRLNVDVRWSPIIGGEFLNDLKLHTIHCLVGGDNSKLASHPSSCGNVERFMYQREPLLSALSPEMNEIRQISVITDQEAEDAEGDTPTTRHRTSSSAASSRVRGGGGGGGSGTPNSGGNTNSYGREEVKVRTHKLANLRKANKKKRKGETDDGEFVYMDRHSLISVDSEMITIPDETHPIRGQRGYNNYNYESNPRDRTCVPTIAAVAKVDESNPLRKKTSLECCGSLGSLDDDPAMMSVSTSGTGTGTSSGTSTGMRSGSGMGTGSSAGGGGGVGVVVGSVGACGGTGSSSQRSGHSPDSITLAGMVEVVINALEEPKDQFPELKRLEHQLHRLEAAFRGGKLTRAPSMTFSESQALTSFDFLGSQDSELDCYRRSSCISSDLSEEEPVISFGSSLLSSSPRKQYGAWNNHFHGNSTESEVSEVFVDDRHLLPHHNSNRSLLSTRSQGSLGSKDIDEVIMQHLIHCEYLLQHFHGPTALRCKQDSALKKLRREAEILFELLNMAASDGDKPSIEHILPELASHEQLLTFWKSIAKGTKLSVSYEQFAIAVDNQFGQSLWVDYPEVANRVFTEILNRILDLDSEECDLPDVNMVITVYQYAAYFLSHGFNAILKCIKEVAQELKMTEGLNSNEDEAKNRIAPALKECGFNYGALVAVAYLLTNEQKPEHYQPAVAYLMKYSGSSPWNNKAVQFYTELLEHNDQLVRVGACAALGKLRNKSVVPQLKYLASGDFTPVRVAAVKALRALGEQDPSLVAVEKGIPTCSNHLKPPSSTIPTSSSSSSDSKKSSPKHMNLQRTRSAETTLI